MYFESNLVEQRHRSVKRLGEKHILMKAIKKGDGYSNLTLPMPRKSP